jgi:hypothetical protein
MQLLLYPTCGYPQTRSGQAPPSPGSPELECNNYDQEAVPVIYCAMVDGKDIRQEDCAQVGVETLW